MGKINAKMAGFYRSRYVLEGQERTIAVTQFQESDARRAFPCLDQPRDKATFDVEMVVDEGRVALSNMPVENEEALGRGKKLVRFAQTPKMSTYLLFFGVGDFEFVQDEGDGRVRAATTPGMSKFAGLGLELGRKSLHFCEAYYGIDYPLPKLDLIAVSDFAFGAMENWGAVTFRENLLLHFADITSKAGKQRIFEVIAHEIAHQWFGNLVTPSDWKYLWLNESFATLFGNRVVSHYHPEWEVWAQFLHADTNRALDRDAMQNTVAHRNARRGTGCHQRSHGTDHLRQGSEHPAPGGRLPGPGHGPGRPPKVSEETRLRLCLQPSPLGSPRRGG